MFLLFRFYVRLYCMDSKYQKILENKANVEDRFIPDHDELVKFAEYCKSKGKKIVLTHGVYDMVHHGHALYLEKAKSYGDILILGLDTDALTKKRKGPNRPIVPEKERILMMSHLRHIDVITIKDVGDRITKLQEIIRPDVLVFSKGTEDVKEEDVKEAKQWCGEVIFLEPQATTSTTARIRQLTLEGAEKLAQEVNKLTQEFLDKIRKG